MNFITGANTHSALYIIDGLIVVNLVSSLRTNKAPASLRRASGGQPPHGCQPPLSMVGLQEASGSFPPLSLLFYPLTLLCAS